MEQEEQSKNGSKNLNRRSFLKCMTWAGTGIVWTVTSGGLLAACGELTNTSTSQSTTTAAQTTNTVASQAASTTASQMTVTSSTTAPAAANSFTFVQVSDSHIGFNTDGVNTDVNGTLQQAISRINAMPQAPALVLHTGDVTHNSKAAEFDTAYQLMTTVKTESVFYVPGEHDVIGDKGKAFRQRFSPKTPDKTWYSMDYKGVHFVALSNAGELDAFGMLGSEQIGWLQKDLAAVNKDTPVIIFAHVPLLTVYQPWAWETKDAAQALALLKPYSSVTLLNGHIHQVVTQVEGNISFYTAQSTAFPQHRPGVDKPNAYKLPASELLQNLGYRSVNVLPGTPTTTSVTDTTLTGSPATPLVLSNRTVAATASATPASVAQNGVADVGSTDNFANSDTSPQKVSLPSAANKTDPQTAFIVKINGQFTAISDVCTHMGCEVSWVGADNKFECPCHGSQYDISGKNIAGPAPKPLPRFKTEIVNGHLMISYL